MSEKKKGNIKNLIPYKPGQSGNPSGKPKSLLTKDAVSKIISEFAFMTPDEIKGVAANPKSTMIEIMIASIIMQTINNGDPSRLNFLFERSPVGRLSKDEPTPAGAGSGYQQIMAELKKFQSDDA